MSVQLAMLVASAVLAVVAVAAAVVAVVALRKARTLAHEVSRAESGDRVARDEVAAYRDHADEERDLDTPARSSQALDHREAEVVRVVEGRVIVKPTNDQIVAASMTRPAVRLNIVAAGLAHALRPESRDRIIGLMRREYRARKRARQRAARAAARATNDPPPSSGRGWVGS
ncbi:hypothetical protein [Aeromicrobium sp. 179-A 4D2 NHS]|uniref:hypothetical protein n=1 Tax=Aeromicrobium sp. 179-A 4D2 NHS TaxID=3142375 RepID=UPI0039A2485A